VRLLRRRQNRRSLSRSRKNRRRSRARSLRNHRNSAVKSAQMKRAAPQAARFVFCIAARRFSASARF
jgi:hypothetical protein